MLDGIKRSEVISMYTFNFFKPPADGGAHAFFTVLFHGQSAAFFRSVFIKRADQELTPGFDGLL